jgi:hypothetical protein
MIFVIRICTSSNFVVRSLVTVASNEAISHQQSAISKREKRNAEIQRDREAEGKTRKDSTHRREGAKGAKEKIKNAKGRGKGITRVSSLDRGLLRELKKPPVPCHQPGSNKISIDWIVASYLKTILGGFNFH